MSPQETGKSTEALETKLDIVERSLQTDLNTEVPPPQEKIQLNEVLETENNACEGSSQTDLSEKIHPTQETIQFYETLGAENNACEGCEEGFKDKVNEEKASGWMNLFLGFTDETSLHGLNYITKDIKRISPSKNSTADEADNTTKYGKYKPHSKCTRFLTRRLIWAFVTAVAFASLLYIVVDRIRFYRLFQKNVDVEINYQNDLEFPAVTICNQNAFKLTSSVAGGYYEEAKAIKNSTVKDAMKCKDTEQECDGKCIDKSRFCDGLPYCIYGSGEKNCGRIQVSSQQDISNEQFTDDFFLDQYYELDTSLRCQNKTVYFTSDVNIRETTYLIYDSDTFKWMFSSLPNAQRLSTLLNSSKTVTTIDKYNGSWVDPKGHSTTLQIDCIPVETTRQDIKSLETSNVPLTDMSRMYEMAGHTMNEMLQKCTWKGVDCLKSEALKTEDTDQGRCFTFTPNDKIDHVGPGFGLSLTVNVQQYEYIKNTQDGVGLQVLLHDPETAPMMAESFAISPGLFSLVSVDRTEVGNLEAPHGQCGTIDLEYYDKYSMSTCNLNCLNKEVRKECRCKEIYMPKPLRTDTDVDYCSVQSYTDCWKPKLDELIMKDDFCQCITPCKEIHYVPSLSFSALNFNPDLAQGEELQKVIQLKESLTQAREVAYRVHDDKFIKSKRLMTAVVRQSLRTQARFQLVEMYIESEVDDIDNTLASVRQDCMWLTKQHQQFIHMLEWEISDVVDKLYHTVYQNLLVRLSHLPQSLEEIVICWNGATCGFETCSLHSWDKTANTTGCNDTCEYSKTKVNLNCKPDLIKTAQAMAKPLIDNIEFSLRTSEHCTNDTMDLLNVLLSNSQFRFTVNPVYLAPLLKDMVSDCKWCLSTNVTLPNLLLSKLTEGISEDISTLLYSITSEIEQLNINFIINGTFLDPTTDRANMSDSIKAVTHLSQDMVSAINTKLKKPIRESAAFFSELMTLINTRCGSEVRNIYTDYMDKHGSLKTDLSSAKQILTNYGKSYSAYLHSYEDNRINLTDLHSESDFVSIRDFIQRANVTLSSRFQEREMALGSIQRHLSKLYYMFLTHVPDEVISEYSHFWKRFNITFPVLNPGDNSTNSINEIYFFNSTEVESFWLDISHQLTLERMNAEVGLSHMLHQLDKARDYLASFVDGNEISENFYRNNFLQVDIFYKELAKRRVQQQEAYGFGALLSEVGGLMGLLVGASVLTLLEFIDFLVYNGYVKYQERRKGNKEKILLQQVIYENVPQK